jgi:uncharacterized membrane protein
MNRTSGISLVLPFENGREVFVNESLIIRKKFLFVWFLGQFGVEIVFLEDLDPMEPFLIFGGH